MPEKISIEFEMADLGFILTACKAYIKQLQRYSKIIEHDFGTDYLYVSCLTLINNIEEIINKITDNKLSDDKVKKEE